MVILLAGAAVVLLLALVWGFAVSATPPPSNPLRSLAGHDLRAVYHRDGIRAGLQAEQEIARARERAKRDEGLKRHWRAMRDMQTAIMKAEAEEHARKRIEAWKRGEP